MGKYTNDIFKTLKKGSPAGEKRESDPRATYTPRQLAKYYLHPYRLLFSLLAFPYWAAHELWLRFVQWFLSAPTRYVVPLYNLLYHFPALFLSLCFYLTLYRLICLTIYFLTK